MNSDFKKILILCKTYPSPSAKHIETSCVAGMDETGKLIRLYPVPFRLVADAQQFKKWQWIRARVKKSSDDHRTESHRISVDTIEILGEPLSTKNSWGERRIAVDPVEVFDSFSALEDARKSRGDAATAAGVTGHRRIPVRPRRTSRAACRRSGTPTEPGRVGGPPAGPLGIARSASGHGDPIRARGRPIRA